MKSIIIPTDFSSCANNAVNFAVQSAKIFPVKITLLHSFEVKGSVYTDYMGVNREFNQSMLNDIKEKLDLQKKSIEKFEAIPVETAISTKALNVAIQEASNEKKADLVAMGTLGASGIKGALWGSNTSSLIGNIRLPVMVVPSEYKWKRPEKILFATNHFERDSSILDFLFAWAGLYMAKIQVVVFSDDTFDNSKAFVERNNEMPLFEKYLKEKYNDDAIITSHITGEGFDDTLQEFINKNDIDTLAMVTYQRNLLGKLFHPSKTKRMSYHTSVPLLALPAARI